MTGSRTFTARRFAGAGLTIAAVAAVVGFGLDGAEPGTRAEARVTAAPASDARWEAVPALPGARSMDVDGAATAVADGRLHVAVVDRARSSRRPSTVLVYRLDDRRWTRVAPALEVNRGGRVDLLGGATPCVAGVSGQSTRLWCAEKVAWRSVGGEVFDTTFPEPVTTYAGAFTSDGRVYVLRAHLQNASTQPGAVAVTGRVEHTAYVRSGDGWRSIGGDLDPSAPAGTQRPFPLTYRGHACIVFNRLSSDPRVGPQVTTRCLIGSTWSDAGVPPITLTPKAGQTLEAINVDGATVADGRLVVGLDHFRGEAVDWPVKRWDGDRWTATPLGADVSGWNEQGTLHTIRSEPWAVRFDQRPSASGLRTRLVVRRQDADGRSREVGRPLIENARFFGPLYWGLEAVEDDVYAMATVPDRKARRNRIAVFSLIDPSQN